MCRESNIAASSLSEGTKGISSTKAVSSNRDPVEKEFITHVADGCINDGVGHISRVVCEELVCVEIYIVRCGITTKDVGHNSCESSSGEAVGQTLAVLVLKVKLSGSASGEETHSLFSRRGSPKASVRYNTAVVVFTV